MNGGHGFISHRKKLAIASAVANVTPTVQPSTAIKLFVFA
jgi:hypothetical protein